MGETLLSRCTNAVDRHIIRTTLYMNDSQLLIAGSHMTRVASWSETRTAHPCQQLIWKASSL